MDRAYLLEFARRERGLTQAQLAAKAGTSQAALSAYERGLKSPTLRVASRILEAAGFDINLRVHIDWKEHHPPGIVAFWTPNILWHVEPPDCFATLEMYDGIGHTEQTEWDMRDRQQRKAAYELLIRRGRPEQMIRWMDGALLLDLWDELDLPDPVREAWRWPIRVAREPVRANIYARGGDATLTALAWNRRLDYLPKPPPPKPRKQRRTRFDPRPPEED
jgi:transcriptional regulator with XRE-family HTH domain